MAEFQIGLSMAGAISAGAYTAGVVDFLCEALSEWEKYRAQPDIPKHRTVIAAMSGASAGGIITALLPVALADGVRPVARPPSMAAPPGGGSANPSLYVLPTLYRAWVEQPTLFEDEKGGLLGIRDLAADDAPVGSALDTTLLDEICGQALTPRGGGQAVPYSWLAKRLHLFLTVSNLHGVPYAIAFTGADERGRPKISKHVVQLHGDRVHFDLRGVGQAVLSSPWAEADPAEWLEIGDLFTGDARSPAWKAFGETALATSAFPIGLKARRLETKAAYFRSRQWPVERSSQAGIEPDWGVPPDATYSFANVDGGMINNEPFELARWSLLKDPKVSTRNPSEGDRADRAVLMVDPFPDPPAFDFAEKQDTALIWVVKKLLPTLQNHARFKLEELVAAADEDRYSRFLIEPRREDTTGPVAPGQEIACGLFGGFGGFLDRRLRAHDYQLGRRNCQWFLRHSFALPPKNPVIAADWTENAKARFQTRDGDGAIYHPIIPLMGTADLPVPAPEWPRLDPGILDILMQNVRPRADAVVDRLIQGSIGNWLLRQLARGVWCCWGRGKLLESVRKAVEADLRRRGHFA
ncbi:MAG: hypothetical protein ACOY3L_12655 [Pseudomonadota bacterium]